jgi:hypothetical protein
MPNITVGRLSFDIDSFRRRVLQQALTEALPSYWERRARSFDDVHPDELPLPLEADPEAAARGSSAAQAALACRRHAWLLAQELPADMAAEIDDVMDEVA